MVWTRWVAGPVAAGDGPVVVSLTEYVAASYRHYPRVLAEGLRLRQGWYAMEGAIGLLLYGDPLRKRGGSVSVWADRAALRRFVGLPRHVAVMRRYRPLGVIRAATWTQTGFDPDEAKAATARWLAGGAIPGAEERD